MSVRVWPAREILARAERLRDRDAAVATGLALLAAGAEVEALELAAGTVETARSRLAAGMSALPRSWTPRPEYPDELPAVVDRIRRVMGEASVEDDAPALGLAQASRAFLRAAALRLAPLVDDGGWLRPECPICGAAPDFAVLAANGERRLLCAGCDAEWTYARVACPFCGTTRHEHLAYHPAGDGAYRLYVCAACSRYLKAVDARLRPEACPPLERLLTVGLDAAAIAAGYRSGGDGATAPGAAFVPA